MFQRQGRRSTAPSGNVSSLILALIVFCLLYLFPPSVFADPPVADAGQDQSVVKNHLLSADIVLDGSASHDVDGDSFTLDWYGPFGTISGATPSVTIPEGSYTVSLQGVSCPENSEPDTTEIDVVPAFTIVPRAKQGKVQLTWTHIPGTLRYDIYRATADAPFSFEKIADTTSTYSTYLDYGVVNETIYLYAVAAVDNNNQATYSNIVSACPPESRSTARLNRQPVIYSPPVTLGSRSFPYVYTVLAADANSRDSIIYSLPSAPSGMSIDSNGRITWTPESTGKFGVTVSVDDGKGLSDTQTFTITVTTPPPTVTLEASPTTIYFGGSDSGGGGEPLSDASGIKENDHSFFTLSHVFEYLKKIGTRIFSADTAVAAAAVGGGGSGGQDFATLSWCATHAEYCVIEPGIGTVETSGTIEIRPQETTTYTITAYGPGGTAVDSETVTVIYLPPTVDITADPMVIDYQAALEDVGDGYGEYGGYSEQVIPAYLNWSSTNATTAHIDQGIGDVDPYGSFRVKPEETTTYTITVTGPGGSATDQVTVTVIYPEPPVLFYAESDDIVAGNNTQLVWDTAFADTVTITPDIGTVDADGSVTIAPEQTTTYTLTAIGPGGTSTATVTVHVSYPAPPVEFTGNPQVLNAPGDTATLTWTTRWADSCTITPDIGPVPVNGSVQVIPSKTTTYSLTATGPGGTTTKTVIIAYPQPEVSLSAEPETIWRGESSTLQWTSKFAFDVSLDNEIGEVQANGSLEVHPTETMTYTITVSNDDGSSTDTATVTVRHAETDLHVDQQGIETGQTATLSWTTTDTETCSLEPGIGTVELNGNHTVSPSETTTYTLACDGGPTSSSSSITVYVNNYNNPPSAVLDAESMTIEKGQSTTLHWHAINGSTYYLDNGIGNVDFLGSREVTPLVTTTYTLTVAGPSGIDKASVTIRVTGDPDPLPEGSFGKMYEHLIPPDATVDAYDARRFSLITGKITGINEQPLAGVKVTVLDHPEYGSVVTDTEGTFYIPVDGGSNSTVQFSKDGLLPSQRQVYVPWNDIAVTETVQMIAEDSVATKVIFDGNPDTVIVHRSEVVSDSSGSRAMTMVFRGDNHAYMVDENGENLMELSSITTRATEYSTSRSMPAVLPATSAYTYCSELTVDGVARVRFAEPVITWVDNFLGFEVGASVPAGYYDRDRGKWVPGDDGLVVRLLDTDSDGKVDSLDSDGDGDADDLNNNGDLHDEVLGLDDPSVYHPGATYMRVAVSHFTPWDFNFCSYSSLSRMLGYGPPDADEQPEDSCPVSTGSFVDRKSLIFHEDIEIPGTNMTLHYASDRADGFKTVITVPASGTDVPASVKRIIVQVKIAGQVLEQVLPPEENQVARFVWDGKDALGNIVTHKVTAHIKIGFVYDSVYLKSGYLAMSFAWFGGDISSVPTRDEVISWQRSEVTVNVADRQPAIAQGWTLSAHHMLAPTDPTTLHKGDGSVVRHTTSVITTVAGNGEETGGAVDGARATQTPVTNPVSVALDAAGNLYIANQVYARILKVDPEGILHVIVGGYYPCSDAEGIPARQACIHIPNGMTLDARGNLYFADSFTCKVRKIDSRGIITTVAGNGECDFSGDEGPALEAGMTPTGVAVDDAGNIYIADRDHYRVRKVDTNGLIRTIAGTGEQYDGGATGDGGPGTEAKLSQPFSVSVDHDGNVYISGNARIRKVDTNGIITTVAGNGFYGYDGDGGLATNAKITSTYGVSFDEAGNFYFGQTIPADNGSNGSDVIRKVDANGYISTVAGTGVAGMSGDDGPSTHAQLTHPRVMAIDPAGYLYIPDSYNHRVRRVSIAGYHEGTVTFAEADGQGYLFTSSGLHQTTFDLETGVPLLDFGYNADNRLISITDRFGNVTTIERDGNNMARAIVSPDGYRTELTVDGFGQLTRITLPDQSFYSFEYAGNDGLLTAKVEPNGNRFEHFFDATGRVTRTTNQEGGTWRFPRSKTYDATTTTEVITDTTSSLSRKQLSTGAVESVFTTPAGEQTNSSRSADGLSFAKHDTCGMQTEIDYDLDRMYGFTYASSIKETTPGGLERLTTVATEYTDSDGDGIPEHVRRTVTRNNRSTVLTHDVENSSRSTTSPESRTTTTFYDADTLLPQTIRIPGLLDTGFDYYPDGRIRSVTMGTRSTTYTYDASGNLATETDPLGRTTAYTGYDALGRVTEIQRPDNSTVRFDYDANGNLTVLTTPTSASNRFAYNRVNLAAAFTTPLGSETRYSYDDQRRLLEITLPSGRTIGNTYENGRLTATSTPEWTTAYTYQCSNLPSSITRDGERIDFSYDGDLLTGISLDGTLETSITLTRNNDFEAGSMTYGGATTTYRRDNDGLLTGSGPFTISRDPANGLPEEVSDGSYSLRRVFNGYGEVASQAGEVNASPVYSWSVERDDTGRIIRKAETVDGITSTLTYAYDSLGRLTDVNRDGTPVESYAYDANGNRILESNSDRGLTDRVLTWSLEDHVITAGDITFEFDADDYLAARIDASGTTEYHYSSTGELMRVDLPDGRSVEYVHDPLGRRIARKVDGVVVEKYLWSGPVTLLAVYDGSDNLLQRFEYGDDRLPPAMSMGAATYYLFYDQVGSLRVVTDAAGNVVRRIDYDSFGNIISDTDPAFTVPFGFAGGLHDPDTGLVRFGRRDYLPEIGKWTAKDPILFNGGDTNLYGYVQNDPVNWVDPWGLQLTCAENLAIGAVGSIASMITNYVVSAVATPAAGAAAGALVGGAVGGLGTMIAGGNAGQIANNAIVGGFTGAIGLLAPGLQGEAAVMAGLADFMSDMSIAGANPLFGDSCSPSCPEE